LAPIPEPPPSAKHDGYGRQAGTRSSRTHTARKLFERPPPSVRETRAPRPTALPAGRAPKLRDAPSAPLAMKRDADFLVGFGKRQLDDLHRDRFDTLVLQEQGLANVVGNGLDQ